MKKKNSKLVRKMVFQKKKQRSKKRKEMNNMAKKQVEQVEEIEVVETVEELKVPSFGLNLDLGREDLNENFRKIQDKLNELSK